MSGERRLILAVDLGATMLRIAVADMRGRILDRVTTPTPKGSDAASVPRGIAELSMPLLARHGGKRCVATVSIASIGPLDIRRGVIAKPPNLPYEEVPIVEGLAEFFDADIVLLNDCNAAVLGEKCYGAGRGVDDLAYVTISSGIGGGVIVDGGLLLGKDGNAAEVGHIVIDLTGTMLCPCGKRGHWEAYASGNSMPRFAAWLARNKYRAIDSPLAYTLRERPEDISPKSIFDYARTGDEFALIFVEELAEINAAGIANIVNAYDPAIVTIGGAVALNNQDLVIEKLRPKVAKYALNRLPEIKATPLGHDAPLLGAVAAAINFLPRTIVRQRG